MAMSKPLRSLLLLFLLLLAPPSLAARNPVHLPRSPEVVTSQCYSDPLPSTHPSPEERTTPWGEPTVHFSSLNGTLSTCCETLDDVRVAINDIDQELLKLLHRRAAYVHEATRFKPTRASVDVPERNEQVLNKAKESAVTLGMPVTIAAAVYQAILDSSVAFEECIFDTFGG